MYSAKNGRYEKKQHDQLTVCRLIGSQLWILMWNRFVKCWILRFIALYMCFIVFKGAGISKRGRRVQTPFFIDNFVDILLEKRVLEHEPPSINAGTGHSFPKFLDLLPQYCIVRSFVQTVSQVLRHSSSLGGKSVLEQYHVYPRALSGYA